MVRERVNAFYVQRQKLPTAILFYRDGIADSMFAACEKGEIPNVMEGFEDAAKHIYADEMEGSMWTRPKLTFVIVGKRHHTRFFPRSQDQTYASKRGFNGNVKPGLLVDQVVTTPGKYNFYLQSHHAVQGTARSAHYYVLTDGMEFGTNNEKLANLTHQLCYSFARASKGVSYVAPAYVADRLCERGRQYLRPWVPSAEFMKPPEKDEDGNDVDLKRWKKKMALQLARREKLSATKEERVWGHYDDFDGNPSSPDKQPRLNPWHPNLDCSMFWM